MQLNDWLRRNDTSVSEFAVMVGASRQAVSQWTNGNYMPKRKFLVTIKRITRGAVTANDFATEVNGK